MMMSQAIHDTFAAALDARLPALPGIAAALIRAPSPNPPLDTSGVAEVAAGLIRTHVPGAEIALHAAGQGVVNVVALVRGHAPGRRMVLNGHLDTYPVNQALPWTVDPLGGEVSDGRIYGRGAADMKGGIAASIVALAALADTAALWPGTVALTLGGDEESMGVLGTQWLLENVAEARGDAAIIGDAGSPRVVRFGEKGFLWVSIQAVGSPAHGAHVHRGANAIDRLRAALDAVTGLRGLPLDAPGAVTAAIAAAQAISEPLSGAGESHTLSHVTVNVGQFHGGTSLNLIPARAEAGVDIRLPVGVSVARATQALAAALEGMAGVTWTILRAVEPSYTAPDGEITRAVVAAATAVLGVPPAVNMRVGGSDSRLFRAAGIPTIVYGPTPHNMGGADEFADLSELAAVARVHALAALGFLLA
jgi:acetylornithine deacetylase/succinyl-diaminopimelate desuccinylase-like protein